MGVFSVPVTIGVNEEEIAKRIEENVEKQVVREITNKVEDIIYNKRGYWDKDEPLREMVKAGVNKILSDNEDKIVRMASEKLAEKLARTKVVKEAAAKKVEDAI